MDDLEDNAYREVNPNESSQQEPSFIPDGHLEFKMQGFCYSSGYLFNATHSQPQLPFCLC